LPHAESRPGSRFGNSDAGTKHVLCREANGVYNRDMLHFHIVVQAASLPWSVTFDEAFAGLEQIPALFIEPDGAFFLASRPGEPPWQVEGNLYDQGERLGYVEVKGSCPEERLDELLRPLGWPEVAMEFQMVREGVVLREEEFREQAKR